ncbi:MAG: hypothetical protein K2M82_01055 [Lachnospiraceae bacterium]|nr:hypothetical protein [Lachnospiraceae bacterium]
MKANTPKINNFVKERNEALFSLDERKIRAYAKKYGIKLPTTEKGFWGGVYKAICNIPDAPPDLKQKAKEWLDDSGLSTKIF